MSSKFESTLCVPSKNVFKPLQSPPSAISIAVPLPFRKTSTLVEKIIR
jgi:hypothetical protein